MTDWTQDGRPFLLTTPLGKDVLLLTSWTGEEHVSSLFRFTVTAISTRADIVAKDLLLKKVSLDLVLPDKSKRTIHGIVSRFSRGGTAPRGYVAYELEIVPPHWALSLDEGFDIFQNKSARDVCTELLTGTPNEWKVSRTLEPRPYCFRYRESRWNMISRLLEQEGLLYRFDHTGKEGKLVVHDASASARVAWGLSKLEYNEHEMLEPRLTSLRMTASPYVAETRVRTAGEFHHTKDVTDVTKSSGEFSPPADITAYRFEQQMTAHRSGITHSGGEDKAQVDKLPTDVKAVARFRQEQAEALAVVYQGTSGYAALEAGAKTSVVDHPNPAMNLDLFVLGVQHAGENGSYHSGDDAEASYSNTFMAIPATTPYRPAQRTPWPHVGGSHVGTVVGPAGEEIYTDKHGRVQVVFKWDKDASTALARSCWIRVAQSFAGQQFGSVFLPRIGHEVLVEFLDGNPDNPVVVGSLYNSANLPPWTLPDNKTQSGVRTKSTLKGGADNHNELRFEDKKDAEQIWVQAEKNLDTFVKNDETRKVDHDRTTTIKNHDTRTVTEGNDTHTIEKGEQTITVKDNKRTLHVEKDHTVTVNGNESVTVKQDRKVVVQANQVHEVTQDNTVTIKGKQTRTITGNDSTKVEQGNVKLEVSLGNLNTEVKLGNITEKASVGSITLEAMQKITLKVGANEITVDQSGVTIKGIMVKIEGTAMTQVKAPITQVDGSGMVMIKGGITMIN
jgi:type VI secretion system secreted protein VgrG